MPRPRDGEFDQPSAHRDMVPSRYQAVLLLAAYCLLHRHCGASHLYAEESYTALLSMNAISVGTLSIFFGIVFSGFYSGPPRHRP